MKPGIHNFSEIGKLNKVLLHRLGDEVEGLVPENNVSDAPRKPRRDFKGGRDRKHGRD